MGQANLREALEKSFEVADEEEQEETGGSVEDSEEPLGDSEEEELEDTGEEDVDDDDESDSEGDDEDSGDESVPDDEDEPGDEEPSEDLKAPASWKPAAREHWNSLKPDVKREILRREGDIQKGLQQASQHKKVAEEYYHTIQPYQGIIRAAGATPSQAISTMFDTAMQLTFGNPKQKAQKVREIIENYSVDIETLDMVLADMEVEDVGDPQLLQAIDQRLQPVTQFMNEMRGYQQNQDTQLQTQVQSDLQAFAGSNEFYEDVRDTMADLMEVAAKHNRTMSLQEAYDQACMITPEVKKVLDHRAAKNAVIRPDKETLRRKKRAASSVADEGAVGGNSSGGANSLRGALESAFEDAENR